MSPSFLLADPPLKTVFQEVKSDDWAWPDLRSCPIAGLCTAAIQSASHHSAPDSFCHPLFSLHLPPRPHCGHGRRSARRREPTTPVECPWSSEGKEGRLPLSSHHQWTRPLRLIIGGCQSLPHRGFPPSLRSSTLRRPPAARRAPPPSAPPSAAGSAFSRHLRRRLSLSSSWLCSLRPGATSRRRRCPRVRRPLLQPIRLEPSG